MSEDFSTYVQGERERLENDRRVLIEHIDSYQRQLRDLDREFAAIDAYERAKTGKPIVRAGDTAPRSHRNGSRRQDILACLGSVPLNAGMTRGELLERFGVKGDKGGEGSISNALSQLQKAGRVVRQNGGLWAIVAQLGDADHVSPALQRAAE